MHLSRKLRQLAAGGLVGLAGASVCLAGHGPLVSGTADGLIAPGSLSNQIWRLQEQNGEASDFVVYEHEFQMHDCVRDTRLDTDRKYDPCDQTVVGGGIRLNYGGEDHVKQIAARLHSGSAFPVVIERSRHGRRLGDTYKFPVHLNPELDMRRREVVVAALIAMGVTNADDVVLVSPAFAEGFTSPEAERAYLRGINPFGSGGVGSGFGRGRGGFAF